MRPPATPPGSERQWSISQRVHGEGAAMACAREAREAFSVVGVEEGVEHDDEHDDEDEGSGHLPMRAALFGVAPSTI